MFSLIYLPLGINHINTLRKLKGQKTHAVSCHKRFQKPGSRAGRQNNTLEPVTVEENMMQDAKRTVCKKIDVQHKHGRGTDQGGEKRDKQTGMGLVRRLCLTMETDGKGRHSSKGEDTSVYRSCPSH